MKLILLCWRLRFLVRLLPERAAKQLLRWAFRLDVGYFPGAPSKYLRASWSSPYVGVGGQVYECQEDGRLVPVDTEDE